MKNHVNKLKSRLTTILFLTMLKKIYFGNKPLFLSDEKTEDLQPYIDDTQTIFQDDLADLPSLIKKMQDNGTPAGIILHDVASSLEKIKKELTVIQASGGLVYSNDNKILLIFRRGKWDLPKGKLDEGEDLITCALREVEEETGLSDLKYKQSLCITYHTYYEKEQHILKESHWQLMKGNDHEELVPQTDEDIEKCVWVTIENLAPYLENAPASIIDVLTAGIKIIK
jgi:8-oxo-dGTP pyrophosphatase MutT (NUDIX family)